MFLDTIIANNELKILLFQLQTFVIIFNINYPVEVNTEVLFGLKWYSNSLRYIFIFESCNITLVEDYNTTVNTKDIICKERLYISIHLFAFLEIKSSTNLRKILEETQLASKNVINLVIDEEELKVNCFTEQTFLNHTSEISLLNSYVSTLTNPFKPNINLQVFRVAQFIHCMEHKYTNNILP